MRSSCCSLVAGEIPGTRRDLDDGCRVTTERVALLDHGREEPALASSGMAAEIHGLYGAYLRTARREKRAAFQSAIEEASREQEIDFTVHNEQFDVASEFNDWGKKPIGEAYRSSLQHRGRSVLAGKLDSGELRLLQDEGRQAPEAERVARYWSHRPRDRHERRRSPPKVVDQTEALAQEYLRCHGMTPLAYEPDGNVPPDFAYRRIAIEVRRLNQQDADGSGLEEKAIPLRMRLDKLLPPLGPPVRSSWWVSFSYTRPIEAWATLQPKIVSALSHFRVSLDERNLRLAIADRFEITLAKMDKLHDNCFVAASYSDNDAGGWIAAETIKNLKVIIQEKTLKVRPFHARYEEWWLVLIDRIAQARLDAYELEAVREHVERPPEWAKIILVNPNQPQLGIEL